LTLRLSSAKDHADYVFSTGGGFQVPLRIEGSFSFGQYMRIIVTKSRHYRKAPANAIAAAPERPASGNAM
jgi:hypothetical protein